MDPIEFCDYLNIGVGGKQGRKEGRIPPNFVVERTGYIITANLIEHLLYTVLSACILVFFHSTIYIRCLQWARHNF